MYIIKMLTDYSKTPFENQLATFISAKLDSSICVEKIKNKEFMIKYIQPINNFIIYNSAVYGSNITRL